MKNSKKNFKHVIKVGDMYVENMRIDSSLGEVHKLSLTSDFGSAIVFHKGDWRHGLSEDLEVLKTVYGNVKLLRITETITTTVQEDEVEYDEEECRFVEKKAEPQNNDNFENLVQSLFPVSENDKYFAGMDDALTRFLKNMSKVKGV